MNLLPVSLSRLADHAAGAEHARFGATTGVQLTVTKDCNGVETYDAVATDERQMIVVQGSAPSEIGEYPAPEALKTAPNSATSAIIPAKTWKESFAKADKLTKRFPKLRHVAVVLGNETTTIGATNIESQMVETARNIDGRFPNWKMVIPLNASPKFKICVDPSILADVLTTIAKLGTNDDNKRVQFCFYGDDKPFTVSNCTDEMPRVTGVVCPLFGPK